MMMLQVGFGYSYFQSIVEFCRIGDREVSIEREQELQQRSRVEIRIGSTTNLGLKPIGREVQ